jgi:hypothetical protein
MLGMFFNPAGFDVIQITLMNLTGSYYRANLVLYCLTAFCFGFYFLYSGSNPITEIKNIFLNLYFGKIKKVLNLFKRNDTSKKI